jgi:AraC-like DNA-binding protein
MKVFNNIPAPEISDYVDRILVIENARVTTPFGLPLFANGTPTLLFQTTRGSIKNNATSNLTLFGQTVFPETLLLKEDFTLIAYFFKPFSLTSLFGLSARELTDNPVDLNLLSPTITHELQERLLNAGTTAEMISLLNQYIYRLIVKTKVDSQLIRYATGLIAHNTSKESLLHVQKEIHVTEKTFQRLFIKSIGIAPNLYRRICQFNAAFQQLNNRRFAKLSDIAFDHGYADQSHYIRVFKEFTGVTPNEYLHYGS